MGDFPSHPITPDFPKSTSDCLLYQISLRPPTCCSNWPPSEAAPVEEGGCREIQQSNIRTAGEITHCALTTFEGGPSLYFSITWLIGQVSDCSQGHFCVQKGECYSPWLNSTLSITCLLLLASISWSWNMAWSKLWNTVWNSSWLNAGFLFIQELLAVDCQHVFLVPSGQDDWRSQILWESFQPGHVEATGTRPLSAYWQGSEKKTRLEKIFLSYAIYHFLCLLFYVQSCTYACMCNFVFLFLLNLLTLGKEASFRGIYLVGGKQLHPSLASFPGVVVGVSSSFFRSGALWLWQSSIEPHGITWYGDFPWVWW